MKRGPDRTARGDRIEREYLAGGKSMRQLAAEHGISKQAVCRLIARRRERRDRKGPGKRP